MFRRRLTCALVICLAGQLHESVWAGEPDDAISHEFCLATPTGMVYDGMVDPLVYDAFDVLIADGPFGPEDVDIYEFEIAVAEPVEVLIFVMGHDPPPVGLDPYIRLFDGAGLEIAFGGEFGTPFADLVHVVNNPGIYYVGVSSWMDDGFGGTVPPYYDPNFCGGTAGPNYTLGWYDLHIDLTSLSTPGACCQPDGSCIEVPAPSCGGNFQGKGTDCGTAQCCQDHPECDDGIFCNGLEICVANVCEPGVPPENNPPVADANGPYSVLVGEGVALDGSGSYDVDVDCGDFIVRFEWDINDDGIYDFDEPDPLLDLPWGMLQSFGLSEIGTDYLIRLRVTDSFDAFDETTTTLTIICDDPSDCDDGDVCNGDESCDEASGDCLPGLPPENVPPVADANGPYTAIFEQPEPITLDGSGSYDPNAPCDEIVWYEWDMNDDGLWDYGLLDPLLDLTWEQLQSYGLDTVGSVYTIRLRVTDGFDAFDETTTTLTIICDDPTDCDDGAPCTVDGCADGVCEHTPLDCDDGDPETIDYCDPDSGCLHEPDPSFLYEPYRDCDPALPPHDPGCALDLPAGPYLRVSGSDIGLEILGQSLSGDFAFERAGNFSHRVTDVTFNGRGIDLVVRRTYRSRTGRPTILGNGWDFSYNMYMVQDGPDLIFYNGDGRRDRFADSGGGIYVRHEYFRTIEAAGPPGSYIMTLKHKTVMTFEQLQPEPDAPSMLTSIADRNGNTMTFEYDPMGRLWKVRDTLNNPDLDNRVIEFAYNEDGFLETMTDWAGRQVRYEYYQDGEEGGSWGDLKSITYPAVVHTPEFPIPEGLGHEYPDGKTWTYTYSKDQVFEWLNHNLLTITDPKEQTFLTNAYDDFDRVMTQFYGNGQYDYAYIEGLVPGPENNQAVAKTFVNNCAGDVKELFYDAGNRLVMHRAYTGRAEPTLPTNLDAGDNPPLDPLRLDDPSSFETRWEYSEDSLCTHMTLPNGSDAILSYDTANLIRRSQGNLLGCCRQAGPLGGDQLQICESFEHDDGPDGTNLINLNTDPRGNDTIYTREPLTGDLLRIDYSPVTQGVLGDIPQLIFEEFEYNAHGQLTRHVHPLNGTNARDDHCTYYDTGPQRGYLESKTVDFGGYNLTTSYDYDAVGNLTSLTDPRGHTATYIHNQLNQVVRSISREVTEGSGIRYETDFFYDANDNVARQDMHNLDEQGTVQPNSHLSTITEYDILDHPVRTCREKGSFDVPIGQFDCTGLPPSEFITTEQQYDANHNPTLARYGEAANGNQPTNVVRTRYDERDLVFQSIRAESDPDQSTTQYDYHLNGNLKRLSDGLEGSPHISTYSYDGYDRLWAGDDHAYIDPEGNYEGYHYDDNGNLLSEIRHGELIEGESGDNVRLSESAYSYDELDRLFQIDEAFFNPASGAEIDDGLATSRIYRYPNSGVQRLEDDNGHATDYTNDTAGRLALTTDAKNNTVTYTYDENSNVINATQVDKSDLPGEPDEIYYNNYTYDGLDRRIRTEDIAANTEDFGYDSRDNLVLFVDAIRPVNPTDPGNVSRYSYDGLDRRITTTHYLTDDGTGTGVPIGEILVAQAWDDTSRLLGQTDDNGNATTYEYDALNRLITTHMADGTAHTSEYDVHDNPTLEIDANGSVVTQSYDALDRLTGKSIAPGPQVDPATSFETYKYDGLSRLVHAEDDDSLVTFSFDSLSSTLSETLNGQATQSVYDGVGNQLQCTYPGGRVISNTYDELNRKKSISDGGGTIATYDYIGPWRVARRDYGNSTRTDYAYDDARRIASTDTRFDPDGVPTNIDLRTYTWNRMNNKIRRQDVRAGGPELTHDYTYDSAYRLTHTTVTDNGGAEVRVTGYGLDGVGNRAEVTGDPDPGPYTLDPTLPDPADWQQNQYTTTPFDARIYDDNGNLRQRNGLVTIGYDYRNQMVQYDDLNTGQQHLYKYDALGRRSERIVDAAGNAQITRYFYDGWQVIEEQDLLGNTLATYVYGRSSSWTASFSMGWGLGGLFKSLVDRLKWILERLRRLGQHAALDPRPGHDNTPKPRRPARPGAPGAALPGGARPAARSPARPPAASAKTPGPPARPSGHAALDPRPSHDSTPKPRRPARRAARGARVAPLPGGARPASRLNSYYYGCASPATDEVLNMQREGADYYYHTDDLLNVMALTDEYGNVVERYDYGDYGQPTVEKCLWALSDDDTVNAADLAQLLGSWGPCPGCPADFDNDGFVNAFDLAQLLGHWGQCPETTSVGNPYLFTGRRFDEETGLYYYRTRYLDPRAGRFVTRDTIGTWGDPANLGNAFSYVGNNPLSYTDPFGMQQGVKFGPLKGRKRRTYNFRRSATDYLRKDISKAYIIISGKDARSLKPGTPMARLLKRCTVIIIDRHISISAGGSFTTPFYQGGMYAMWGRRRG